MSHLVARLRTMIDSSSAPLYIDFDGVPSASRRQSRPTKRSLLDYLVPSGSALDEVGEVAELLAGSKRQVKSATSALEKLRLIKSDAEIKVMRKAADLSSKGHAKVSEIGFGGQLRIQSDW